MKKNNRLFKNKNRKMTSKKVEDKDQEQEVKVNTSEENVEQETPATEGNETPETQEQPVAQDEVQEVNPIEELEAKLKAEEEKVAEMNDRYLRLSAEFDNYRKRTLKEKTELIMNGGEKAISSILPVLDDLERAMQNMQKATDVNAVREGVDLIYNKFMQVLGQNGVKLIETEGKALDTDYHEAIALIDAPAEELKGKILDCVQKGYTLNDKVIRHAKVVIGK